VPTPVEPPGGSPTRIWKKLSSQDIDLRVYLDRWRPSLQLAHPGQLPYGREVAPGGALPELTEREEEVLSLVTQGKTNQQIAKELFVSLKTVRNHVSNIFLKLQVADRAQAVIRAREAGLGHEKT
jgi:DNA-binding NarL/FixJ family response regulator